MKKIEFPKEAKATIISSIRRYFETELDQQIGALPAEFLLDFFAEEIGAHYYNQGLRDAHATLRRKMEDLAEDIYLLERDEKNKAVGS